MMNGSRKFYAQWAGHGGAILQQIKDSKSALGSFLLADNNAAICRFMNKKAMVPAQASHTA